MEKQVCPCDYDEYSEYDRELIIQMFDNLMKRMAPNGMLVKKMEEKVVSIIQVFESGKISTRGLICYIYYLHCLALRVNESIPTCFLVGQHQYWKDCSSCLSVEDRQHFRDADLSFMFDGLKIDTLQ